MRLVAGVAGACSCGAYGVLVALRMIGDVRSWAVKQGLSSGVGSPVELPPFQLQKAGPQGPLPGVFRNEQIEDGDLRVLSSIGGPTVGT